MQIEVGECVLITWTIEHVKAVYFNFGQDELLPSNDNWDRTEEFCSLRKTTDFEWHIVFADSDDNDANNYVRVERRTVLVKPKETPTPFTILIATPTWTPVGPTPPVQN